MTKRNGEVTTGLVGKRKKGVRWGASEFGKSGGKKSPQTKAGKKRQVLLIRRSNKTSEWMAE